MPILIFKQQRLSCVSYVKRQPMKSEFRSLLRTLPGPLQGAFRASEQQRVLTAAGRSSNPLGSFFYPRVRGVQRRIG